LTKKNLPSLHKGTKE